MPLDTHGMPMAEGHAHMTSSMAVRNLFLNALGVESMTTETVVVRVMRTAKATVGT